MGKRERTQRRDLRGEILALSLITAFTATADTNLKSRSPEAAFYFYTNEHVIVEPASELNDDLPKPPREKVSHAKLPPEFLNINVKTKADQYLRCGYRSERLAVICLNSANQLNDRDTQFLLKLATEPGHVEVTTKRNKTLVEKALAHIPDAMRQLKVKRVPPKSQCASPCAGRLIVVKES